MASVYDLKPRFQEMLRPAVDRLANRGITANQVTLAGVAVSGLGGLLIWLTDAHWLTLLVLPGFLLARMALNAIDGMLAREHGQQTLPGMFLNELADLGSDALLYLPLGVAMHVSPVMVGLAVMGGAVVEMAGVMGPLVGADRRYDGPFGKSDRAVFWAILAVLLAIGLGGWWVDFALAAAIGLCVWTAIRRCRMALGQDDA